MNGYGHAGLERINYYVYSNRDIANCYWCDLT